MSINGELTKLDDGAYTGWIADLTFDVNVTLIDNTFKQKDSHPDFAVNGKSPSGRDIRVGSAWAQTSKAGNEYLSLALDVAGNSVRVNALPDQNDDTKYQIVAWTD